MECGDGISVALGGNGVGVGLCVGLILMRFLTLRLRFVLWKMALAEFYGVETSGGEVLRCVNQHWVTVTACKVIVAYFYSV